MKQQRGTFSYQDILDQRAVFSELDTTKKGLDGAGMELFRLQCSYPFNQKVVEKLMTTWGKPIQYSQFVNLYHGLRKKVKTMSEVEAKMLDEL